MGAVLLDVSGPTAGGSLVVLVLTAITAVLEWIRRSKRREERAMQSVPASQPKLQPITHADILVRLRQVEAEAAMSRTRWEVEELRRHLDEVSADSAKTAAALTAERKLRERLEADLIDRDAVVAQRDRLIAQLRRELAAARRRSAPIAIETPFRPSPEAPSSVDPERIITPLLPAARRRPPKGTKP